ncbi:hypothetical protein JS756_31895 [Streptomyces actuosus]|uniref:YCII-related domain-containing protein n=1 Tax=Streptomyces actuosus TaxID=1885 RepID=A0ABS2VZM9_STRAS|nr:YciI family protein [Streptomyces actuosus]MBN0048613.1 hypothetical protein [Streptomyces actuosus]
MFVLELNYTAPLDAVDALLDAHVAWLDGHYTRGTFLASGRKEPREGGIVLAVAESRAQVEELTAGDPFVVAGVCTYRITEFIATRTAPELAAFRETLA